MVQAIKKSGFPLLVCISMSLLSGCFETDDSTNRRGSSAFANIPGVASAPPGRNNKPSIAGKPSSIAVIDATWSFTPSASDSDGDALTFSIRNQPNWAQFDAATGRLSGQPRRGQEGSYQNISITVSDGEALAALSSFAITVQKGTANNAPIISGRPPTSATVGQQYSFFPSATDVDNDALTFAIANRPAWASFSPATGLLSGTPRPGESAVYDNIVISVSDGELMSSMPAFAINVTQVGTNAITLTLIAPTENEDGTPLTDLAAYKIYYGRSAGSYPNEISVNNPGITNYVVENLAPDTYFFVSTSINSKGLESEYSNVVTKMVN